MIDSPENNDKKPYILVVDDVPKNLQVIGETLAEVGYDISPASNGLEALEILKAEKPDLILLDIMMPELDGYGTIERIKKDPELRDIPVIFLTAKSETEDIVKGFELGGVDYITKPFQGKEVTARIKTHLELKFAKEKIERVNAKLNQDLVLASTYVRSLLPEEIDAPDISAKLIFRPCEHLGGDAPGFHRIDKDKFAFYLLDVCGHGVGPALHSVTALNTLRFQLLPGCDFTEPKEVFTALNTAYQMTDYNDMYFTIFYGVYDKSTRELKYSSAGHPPAILVNASGKSEFLEVRNFLIGGMPEFDFVRKSVKIEPNSSVYVYSDGAYEIKLGSGKYWSEDELKSFLTKRKDEGEKVLEELYEKAKDLSATKELEDDFTVLKIDFKE